MGNLKPRIRCSTGFVLKYRLGSRYHHPAPLQDAARAIRLVRARAAEWQIDPKRIGILGFSAGGHVASTIGTHFDAGQPNSADAVEKVSSRPDVMVLIYPVITMGGFTHSGSRKRLLGENPSADMVTIISIFHLSFFQLSSFRVHFLIRPSVAHTLESIG